MKTVLTIAGFDPSSGAGITADLMVFAAHGLFGTACITALTVQSTVGVASMHPVESAILRSTLERLQPDLPPAGVKIGMMGSSENIHVISTYLEGLNPILADCTARPAIILDPVIRSSSGRELVDGAGLTRMRARMIPLVNWITPNVDELAWLSGRSIASQDELRDAARAFQDQSGEGRGEPLGVFAKGGHLEQPDDLLLSPDGREVWFPGRRIETRATHGTGCALSSAFLSRLVLGEEPEEAARRAKEYVARAMETAQPIGHGRGPMNHLWPLRKPLTDR